MTLSRPISWFMAAFGAWSWVIWITFLQNVTADPRSWQSTGSPTSFFVVHLVLTVVSLVLGTVVGIIGIRGLLAARRKGAGQETRSAPAQGRRLARSRDKRH